MLCTRARSGLVLIGNAQCLGSAPHWAKLLGHLRERGSVFGGLPTQCQVHGIPDDPSALSTAEQIHARVQRGAGCWRKCDDLLPCGHPCPLDCHPFDREHTSMRCPQLVRTRCLAGLHPIDKACCDAAPPLCQTKVVEPCGNGHFAVRGCGERVAECAVCALLDRFEQKAADATVERAQQEATLVEQAARAAACAAVEAAAAASKQTPRETEAESSSAAAASKEMPWEAEAGSSSALPAASKDTLREAEVGLSSALPGASAAEAAQEEGGARRAPEAGSSLALPAAAGALLDPAIHAALREVAALYEERQRKMQLDLGAALDQQQRRAQAALARAHGELRQQEVREGGQLQARRAATEAELGQVAARLEAQRTGAAEAAEADLLERATKLHALHDALAADLRLQQAAMDEALAARPPAEAVATMREKIRGMVPATACVVCMDEKLPLFEGVQCCGANSAAGHFTCDECFSLHVGAETERLEFDGEVRCPMATEALGERRCASKPYPAALLASHAAGAFEAFTRRRLQLRESQLVRELEKDYAERYERKLEELKVEEKQERQVCAARRHIVENILTLACPRCRVAFIDFEGCLALKCRSCACGFCALCLKDCGPDAHSHLASCEQNRGGSLYGTASFEEAHRTRRRAGVESYLHGKELRGEILAACEKELRDLRLWPL